MKRLFETKINYFNQLCSVCNVTYKHIQVANFQFFDLKCFMRQSTIVTMAVEFSLEILKRTNLSTTDGFQHP